MVGATAFMETLELAVELRRAGYGTRGERLGFDLYPYTEDEVGAVQAQRAAVALHRRRRGSRIDDAALREAQQDKDAIRAYELVYAALGARGLRQPQWSLRQVLARLDRSLITAWQRPRSVMALGGHSLTASLPAGASNRPSAQGLTGGTTRCLIPNQ